MTDITEHDLWLMGRHARLAERRDGYYLDRWARITDYLTAHLRQPKLPPQWRAVLLNAVWDLQLTSNRSYRRRVEGDRCEKLADALLTQAHALKVQAAHVDLRESIRLFSWYADTKRTYELLEFLDESFEIATRTVTLMSICGMLHRPHPPGPSLDLVRSRVAAYAREALDGDWIRAAVDTEKRAERAANGMEAALAVCFAGGPCVDDVFDWIRKSGHLSPEFFAAFMLRDMIGAVSRLRPDLRPTFERLCTMAGSRCPHEAKALLETP